MNIWQYCKATTHRPHNRCPDVRGLYFAGCTTHPSGGMPMVALSGKTVARTIGKDASQKS
jgi:phytoene dehydrogenase-like protein